MKLGLLIAGIGSCLVSGVLFAFSSFVMAGLARIAAPAGIAAMQAINITVINFLFMGLFLGMGLLSIVLAVMGIRESGLSMSGPNLAALIYVVGVLGVTFVANVPMNDALASLDPAANASAAAWQDYLSRWTMWNHVRCTAALIAGVLFLIS